MYRARQDKLIHKLQNIFARKAGFDIDVVVDNDANQEAPSKEYEYVRLENRPASAKAQASGNAPEHNAEVPDGMSEGKESF